MDNFTNCPQLDNILIIKQTDVYERVRMTRKEVAIQLERTNKKVGISLLDPERLIEKRGKTKPNPCCRLYSHYAGITWFVALKLGHLETGASPANCRKILSHGQKCKSNSSSGGVYSRVCVVRGKVIELLSLFIVSFSGEFEVREVEFYSTQFGRS